MSWTQYHVTKHYEGKQWQPLSDHGTCLAFVAEKLSGENQTNCTGGVATAKGEDASKDSMASCGATEEVHQFWKYALGCCLSTAKRRGNDLLRRPWCGQCCSWGWLSPVLLPVVHKQIRIEECRADFNGKEIFIHCSFKALFIQVEHALLELKQVMTLLKLRDWFVEYLREEGVENRAYCATKFKRRLILHLNERAVF